MVSALPTPEPTVLAAAILVALAWDRLLGEPPVRWHPVVWMGRYLDVIGRRVAPAPDAPAHLFGRRLAGAVAWLVGAVICAGAAWGWGALWQGVPWAVEAVAWGVALKPLFAWRLLRDEVAGVEEALTVSLEAGRAQVARLVSRDASALDETGVREAAIATLAENLNDSVVAPVFWFVLLGLPGAALYRYANTADAMWGYRGVRAGRDWTAAGWWAARVDDVLSWLPARLTALGIALALGGVSLGALRTEARRTPSPNGGWPMGAMALVLGVRLGKPGVYVLHPRGRDPSAADTVRALRGTGAVVGGIAAVALGALVAGIWGGVG